MINEISFNEVYDIICHMDYELYHKIPLSFINFIQSNMKANYEVNIDYSKGINEQDLQKDTRILLSLIYRDYLCTLKEKTRLLRLDELEIEKLKEKYNPDNLFKQPVVSKEQVIESKINEDMQIVEYKKISIFSSIIRKLKEFFKRK